MVGVIMDADPGKASGIYIRQWPSCSGVTAAGGGGRGCSSSEYATAAAGLRPGLTPQSPRLRPVAHRPQPDNTCVVLSHLQRYTAQGPTSLVLYQYE